MSSENHNQLSRAKVSDCNVVESYAHSGVLLQINAGSLLGNYGRKEKAAAKTLVKKNIAHMMASDTHGRGSIKDSLNDAFTYIERLVGYDRAVELSYGTPSRLAL